MSREQQLIQQIEQLWKEWAACDNFVTARHEIKEKIDAAMQELSTIPEGTK